MPESTQNFENHTRWVPTYHYVLAPIVLINLIWSLYKVVVDFSADRVMALLLAAGFLLLFYHSRQFAKTVQDRVIRLEMRLRLERILPPDLRARINDFTLKQLIALRFASDAELPDLARKVLNENLTDGTAIKRMVRNWQPDLLRA
jgi:hypothetical protein